MVEKRTEDDVHQDVDEHLEKEPVVAKTKVVQGDEGYQQALMKEPPRPFAAPSIILCSLVAFCCSTCNGYDGSLFGTLLANERFLNWFDVGSAGLKAGIVTSMYQIGSVVGLPFVGPALDTWGRRRGMFIGGVIIILGVIIQLTCVHSRGTINEFMAGRFFLGFGVSIIGAAGPTYVVEITHPAYRGLVTALYNVMWPVGALVASGVVHGGLNYNSNASWMLPLGVQMMFPGIVVIFSLMLPESPRWLYTRGKREEATEFLTKYHGYGNPNSEWVKLQLVEYAEFLEMDGADKRWWDYRALFATRASRYRLMVNCLMSACSQWAGNSIVSYYLIAFLQSAGIVGSEKQTSLSMGMNGIQIVFAMVGSLLVEHVGRRTMAITVNIACGLSWVGVIIPASIANITNLNSKSQAAAVPPPVSKAVLAWIYLFQIFYSVGYTPLQALYPVEVLSYEMRAKGMAFSGVFTSAALLTTQFGNPVGLANIHWRYYIIWSVWCIVQAVIFYFLFPETKNRTLEELDEIFNAKNPVKKSIEKKKLDVDANENIVHVDVAGHASTGSA